MSTKHYVLILGVVVVRSSTNRGLTINDWFGTSVLQVPYVIGTIPGIDSSSPPNVFLVSGRKPAATYRTYSRLPYDSEDELLPVGK
jgi:hypothetical protein